MKKLINSDIDYGAIMGTQMFPQSDVERIEQFLHSHYNFRYNELSDKVEYRCVSQTESEEGKTLSESKRNSWFVFDDRAENSMVLKVRKTNLCKQDPANNIRRIVYSLETPIYNPIKEWLDGLPEWDGRNRVTELFGRIPGISTQQIYWCAIWLRAAVAQWKQMSMVHGNECVIVLIGRQGCGKSTFCLRILPDCLHGYFLDHINFENKFDSDMALTNNLLVNIDEFDRLKASRQAALKQTLSRVRVNSRPIYSSVEEDRPRFASFTATTNKLHPLTDPTGSRRYICIQIPRNQRIDFESPIDYEQLYAQVCAELQRGERFWFTEDETKDIEQTNLPYRETDALEESIVANFSIAEDEGSVKPLRINEIAEILSESNKSIVMSHAMKTKLGSTLRMMRCKTKHTNRGQVYYLVPLA